MLRYNRTKVRPSVRLVYVTGRTTGHDHLFLLSFNGCEIYFFISERKTYVNCHKFDMESTD